MTQDLFLFTWDLSWDFWWSLKIRLGTCWAWLKPVLWWRGLDVGLEFWCLMRIWLLDFGVWLGAWLRSFLSLAGLILGLDQWIVFGLIGLDLTSLWSLLSWLGARMFWAWWDLLVLTLDLFDFRCDLTRDLVVSGLHTWSLLVLSRGLMVLTLDFSYDSTWELVVLTWLTRTWDLHVICFSCFLMLIDS